MQPHSVNIAINLIMLAVILDAVYRRKHTVLFFMCTFSVTIGMFGLQFLGPNIQFSQVIGVLLLPRTLPYFLKRPAMFRWTRPLVLEFVLLILLGLYFGFINPWYDPSYPRPFNQSAPGRTIITWVREVCDIALVLYVMYAFEKKHVTLKTMFICVLASLLINTSVAVITSLTPLNIRAWALGARELPDRFTGFDNEPKHFGKNSAMSLAFFSVLLFTGSLPRHKRKLQLGMLVCVANVFLSGSTSSVLLLGVLSATIMLFIRWNPLAVMGSRVYPLVIFGFALLVFGAWHFSNTQYFQSVFANKVYKALGIQPEPPAYREEPTIFRQWEVWDRSAANFLYDKPLYAVIGAGPNLVHIPATRYASREALGIYKTGLNSVPKMGWLYIIARSGLIGLSLYIYLVLRMLKLSRARGNLKAYLLTICLFIFVGLTMDYWFYYLLGFLFHAIGPMCKTDRNRARVVTKPRTMYAPSQV